VDSIEADLFRASMRMEWYSQIIALSRPRCLSVFILALNNTSLPVYAIFAAYQLSLQLHEHDFDLRALYSKGLIRRGISNHLEH
jgi:hypothetical protein